MAAWCRVRSRRFSPSPCAQPDSAAQPTPSARAPDSAARSIALILSASITALTSRIIRISSVKIFSKWTRRDGQHVEDRAARVRDDVERELAPFERAIVADDAHAQAAAREGRDQPVVRCIADRRERKPPPSLAALACAVAIASTGTVSAARDDVLGAKRGGEFLFVAHAVLRRDERRTSRDTRSLCAASRSRRRYRRLWSRRLPRLHRTASTASNSRGAYWTSTPIDAAGRQDRCRRRRVRRCRLSRSPRSGAAETACAAHALRQLARPGRTARERPARRSVARCGRRGRIVTGASPRLARITPIVPR